MHGLNRKAKSSASVMVRLVDELLEGYTAGFPCIDSSRTVGRKFRAKTILLYWVGDYPGIGEASGMPYYPSTRNQCHWCKHQTPAFLPNHYVFLNHCDHLPRVHSMRSQVNRSYTDYPPPEPRSHDETVQHGQESHNWLFEENVPAIGPNRRQRKAQDKEFPGKRTMVYEPCLLALLAFFCMVMDFCPDVMHILKNIWQSHYWKVLKGERRVKKPKPKGIPEDANDVTKRLINSWNQSQKQRWITVDAVDQIQTFHA